MANDIVIYTAVIDALNKQDNRVFPYASAFESAVPFNIQQVYHWLTMEKSGTALNKLLHELPSCKPPFTYTFFEWTVEPDDEDRARGRWVTQMGAIAYTAERSQLKDTHISWEMVGLPNDQDTAFEPDYPHDPKMLIPEDGCVVWIRPFIEFNNGHIGTLKDTHAFIGLDGEGNVVRETDPNGITWLAYRANAGKVIDDESDDERTQARTTLSEIAYTALFACSLLHCKNVSAIDNVPPRQYRRQRERHNLPVIGWKTLSVTPHVTQRQAQTRHIPGDDLHKKRQHVVRGHFAEYGYNGHGLLFGRIQGRFWVPPHIRGIDGPGVLLKDYAVQPTAKVGRRRTP